MASAQGSARARARTRPRFRGPRRRLSRRTPRCYRPSRPAETDGRRRQRALIPHGSTRQSREPSRAPRLTRRRATTGAVAAPTSGAARHGLLTGHEAPRSPDFSALRSSVGAACMAFSRRRRGGGGCPSERWQSQPRRSPNSWSAIRRTGSTIGLSVVSCGQGLREGEGGPPA
jgi:hypothetical protein